MVRRIGLQALQANGSSLKPVALQQSSSTMCSSKHMCLSCETRARSKALSLSLETYNVLCWFVSLSSLVTDCVLQVQLAIRHERMLQANPWQFQRRWEPLPHVILSFPMHDTVPLSLASNAFISLWQKTENQRITNAAFRSRLRPELSFFLLDKTETELNSHEELQIHGI